MSELTVQRRLLERAHAELADLGREVGDDHSVGICSCELLALVQEIGELLGDPAAVAAAEVEAAIARDAEEASAEIERCVHGYSGPHNARGMDPAAADDHCSGPGSWYPELDPAGGGLARGAEEPPRPDTRSKITEAGRRLTPEEHAATIEAGRSPLLGEGPPPAPRTAAERLAARFGRPIGTDEIVGILEQERGGEEYLRAINAGYPADEQFAAFLADQDRRSIGELVAERERENEAGRSPLLGEGPPPELDPADGGLVRTRAIAADPEASR